MKDGFLKAAAFSPALRVADCTYNAQQILEQLHPVKRLELTIRLLAQELDILQLENEISEKVQENVNKNQRDYFLREQMRAIEEELGEGAVYPQMNAFNVK